MYLSYNEYTALGGNNKNAAFVSAEMDSEIKIDYYTQGRLKNDNVVSNNVKLCMKKLVDLIVKQNDIIFNGNKQIKSQSNDGVSTSYGDNLKSDDYESIICDTINIYLSDECNESGENLLYRGVTL